MIENMFSIYDAKAENYGPPVRALNKATIIRTFTDLANNPQEEIGEHPEDYTLFHLGTYDSTTGKFENLKAPVALGLAQEYVRNE